jgi:thioredoxin 1
METHTKPVEVTDQNFADKVEKATGLSVVDLWAVWCGPCRMIAPIVEELATEYAGKVSFFKLDVDNNPATAQKYMVRSIPTLLFFKDGKMVDTVIGALPKEKLVGVIKKHL